MKASIFYLYWLAHGTEAWQSVLTSNQLKLGSSRLGPRLNADRFGPPGLEGQVPTILDVARPLMDAAKALERAGTTVVSFAGDERPIFDGGTQLVNAARDLEDAGAMGRMRPGLFAEEPQLKIRAAGEALQTAGELLQEESLIEGGRLAERCGEDLGRGDKASAAANLRAASGFLTSAVDRLGERLTTTQQEAANAGSSSQSSSDSNASAAAGKGKGWLAGLTERMVGAPSGNWRDVAADLAITAKELEAAGETLAACRVGKTGPR